MSTELNVHIHEHTSRIAVLETRVSRHDGDIQAIEKRMDWAANDAANSRSKIHNRINEMDAKVSTMIISGQKQMIITLVGFIFSLVLMFANIALNLLMR